MHEGLSEHLRGAYSSSLIDVTGTPLLGEVAHQYYPPSASKCQHYKNAKCLVLLCVPLSAHIIITNDEHIVDVGAETSYVP